MERVDPDTSGAIESDALGVVPILNPGFENLPGEGFLPFEHVDSPVIPRVAQGLSIAIALIAKLVIGVFRIQMG